MPTCSSFLKDKPKKPKGGRMRVSQRTRNAYAKISKAAQEKAFSKANGIISGYALRHSLKAA
jgi:hypothetical protein